MKPLLTCEKLCVCRWRWWRDLNPIRLPGQAAESRSTWQKTSLYFTPPICTAAKSRPCGHAGTETHRGIRAAIVDTSHAVVEVILAATAAPGYQVRPLRRAPATMCELITAAEAWLGDHLDQAWKPHQEANS